MDRRSQVLTLHTYHPHMRAVKASACLSLSHLTLHRYLNAMVSVCMVGAGEYTAGFVPHAAGAASDKPAGVVAITCFDLRRLSIVSKAVAPEQGGVVTLSSDLRECLCSDRPRVVRARWTALSCAISAGRSSRLSARPSSPKSGTSTRAWTSHWTASRTMMLSVTPRPSTRCVRGCLWDYRCGGRSNTFDQQETPDYALPCSV